MDRTDSAAPATPGGPFRRALGEWRIGLVAWRLLVLQTAHPAVAAGIARYSTYRAHPWRRIEHTMDSGRRLFFSTPEARRREVARLERAHRRIGGTDDAGRPYTPRTRGPGLGAGHPVRVHDGHARTVGRPPPARRTRLPVRGVPRGVRGPRAPRRRPPGDRGRRARVRRPDRPRASGIQRPGPLPALRHAARGTRAPPPRTAEPLGR